MIHFLGEERLSFMPVCRCSLAMPQNQDEIFQSLVEASADFIGTIDREGNFLYLNPAGRRMLEIPADEDLMGAINRSVQRSSVRSADYCRSFNS
jgi:PAS domain-containing protein